jgi:hypothetical protein
MNGGVRRPVSRYWLDIAAARTRLENLLAVPLKKGAEAHKSGNLDVVQRIVVVFCKM